MNETYSSAMWTRADGSRTRYRTSTGSPSTIETRSLLRFDSHQRGAARGRTAIPRRMTANGTAVETGKRAADVTAWRLPGRDGQAAQGGSRRSNVGGRGP